MSGRPIQPNFLIVGAARSGTTSLYHWLRQHPQVFLPENKEPAYFVDGFGIATWREYLALFSAAGDRPAVGEASPQYLDAPESPQWIRHALGPVKIVILLRNPIERAASLHALATLDGSDWIPTLREAMAREDERMADPAFRSRPKPAYFRHYFYVHSGRYHDDVKHYFDLFGRESVRVHLFEDLKRDPAGIFSDVCGFLGIAADFRPALEPQNPGRIPRFVRLHYALHRLAERSAAARWPLADGLLRRLLQANAAAGRKPSVDPGLRRELAQFYRSDVARLGALLGRDLSGWLA